MHVVLLWVFAGGLWGAGEYQRGLSPGLKYTFKAHLDFSVQAIEVSFLKKHLEKMEGKSAQLFSTDKTQTFLPTPSYPPANVPFNYVILRDPLGTTS